MNELIDLVLFEEAKDKIIGQMQGLNGIGTLSEKTVHAVLKYYYAPNVAYHEQKIGTFVADICLDGEIYEIQTRQFHLLRKKLDYFLTEHDVTVVYPISAKNAICYIDPQTGEMQPPRKSSRKGTKYEILPELYKIKMYLNNPSLHFILVFLETEEYRLLDGYGKNKRRKATKTDKFPITIIDEIRINHIKDYLCFLPDTLPIQFTSADYAKEARINKTVAAVGLNVFTEIGVVERIGKQGNFIVYKKLNFD